MVKSQNSQDIGIKFTIIDCSNFDKRCSGAHLVSFLSYHCCLANEVDINTLKEDSFRVHLNIILNLQRDNHEFKAFGTGDGGAVRALPPIFWKE